MKIFGKNGNMKINAFFKKYMTIERFQKFYTFDGGKELHKQVITRNPNIFCRDGFSMSVQVGENLYSTPKGYAERYKEAEIGYPSERESLIEEYAENIWEEECDYTDTVYPYVPCEIIDMVIEKHGGIDEVVVQEKMSSKFHEHLKERNERKSRQTVA